LQFLTFQSYSDNVKNAEVIVQKMIADAKKHAVKTIKLSPKERSLKIEILIKRFINLDFMARATTGSYWKKATNTQKEKYKSALLKQIVNTIEEHLNTLARLSYKPLKSEARGKKLVYIRGIIVDDSKKIPDVNLLWKLAKDKKGNFLVLDLEIEGISLISSHKAETMSILRKNKGDFNALLGTFTKSE
jgi:ABC-type transporter MlaC component